MSTIGQPERATQDRVIALFRDELGYRYLGDWTDRDGNSNIEEGLLAAHLTRCGYRPMQITKAIHELRTEADNPNRSLYDNNKAVYSLLGYGVKVKAETGENYGAKCCHLSSEWIYRRSQAYSSLPGDNHDPAARGNGQRRGRGGSAGAAARQRRPRRLRRPGGGRHF